MSRPCHNSVAESPDHRGFELRWPRAVQSSKSVRGAPFGETVTIAFWYSWLALSATGFEFLFFEFAKSRMTPMSAKALLSDIDSNAFALSTRQMTFLRLFGGLIVANNLRRPDSRDAIVSLGTMVAHVYDVAVSLRVRIFCF